ncbi:MAG: helix-turn-helix transcriptional regulator [Oscillospiraceae bacterium]|nr:helix-turn-helix transcriptional regulator [Oscillospiraceae bacterium]
MAKRYFGDECTIGVSRVFDRLQYCGIAYREAVDAARLAEDPGIHHVGAVQAMSERQMISESDIASRFDTALFSGDPDKLEGFLREAFLSSSSELAVLQIFMVCQGVLRASLGDIEAKEMLRSFGLQDPLGSGLDLDSLKSRVIEFCVAGQAALANSSQAGIEVLVNRALNIIENRYMEDDLSLGSVSEELHVSPNYLSANMKKYAGDTFVNLLINRRMEAAKSLVQRGQLKIGEIAEACGYTDQHYFSFCFKKYYGVSPVKMRHAEVEA